ncbi:MAG: preprotein translocase subunit SecG [Chitinophagales bacterium]
MMYTIVTILAVVAGVLLGAIVLIQNPKGGGLNSSFGGVGQQLLGARRSTDVVEKSTWILAAALLFFCLSTAFFVGKKSTVKAGGSSTNTELMDWANKGGGATTPQPTQTPATPKP